MNVLSLFDGMGCGRVALERAGVRVNNYFASEIDRFAIKIAQKNYPSTIQLGDIRGWGSWELPKIDLVIGGSPCQGFSFAGEQLAFDDPRSKLFFEYVECIKKFKPKYFLMENVRMKKEYLEIISRYLGVQPIEINSSLVSAQNRVRYYWTNIPRVTPPADRGILLEDIILKEGLPVFKKNILHSDRAIKYMNREVRGGRNHWDFKHHSDVRNKKSQTLVANFFRGVPYNVLKDFDCIRKFHPIECERLQTVPDGYTEGVSDTQRYRMLGNGWTVDVVAHLFKNLCDQK